LIGEDAEKTLTILQLKAVETIARVHEAQLLTYLKLTGKPIGLLLNSTCRI
jgi:GxxExxY protein